MFSVEPTSSKTNYKEIAEYICYHEGFVPGRYRDVSGGGDVIGCGIRAGNRQTITFAESVSIIEREVGKISKQVVDVYGNVSQDRMKGLVSIAYNTPMKKDILRNKALVAHIKNGNRQGVEEFYELLTRRVEKHAGQSLNGLRTRRGQELNLIFS